MKVRRRDLSLIKRLFLVDLIRGLKLTFSYQKPSENYTEQYPKERPKISERFRGAPRLNNDPVTGETLCIACNLCALACPEPVSYTHLRAHETGRNLVCRLLLEKK